MSADTAFMLSLLGIVVGVAGLLRVCVSELRAGRELDTPRFWRAMYGCLAVIAVTFASVAAVREKWLFAGGVLIGIGAWMLFVRAVFGARLGERA